MSTTPPTTQSAPAATPVSQSTAPEAAPTATAAPARKRKPSVLGVAIKWKPIELLTIAAAAKGCLVVTQGGYIAFASFQDGKWTLRSVERATASRAFEDKFDDVIGWAELAPSSIPDALKTVQ